MVSLLAFLEFPRSFCSAEMVLRAERVAMWVEEKGIDSLRSGEGGRRNCCGECGVVGGGGDRGCGDGGMVGGGGDRGCGDGGVVGVVVIWGAMLVVVRVVEMWLVQNNDRERKTLPQRITARLTRRISSKQRWGNLSNTN